MSFLTIKVILSLSLARTKAKDCVKVTQCEYLSPKKYSHRYVAQLRHYLTPKPKKKKEFDMCSWQVSVKKYLLHHPWFWKSLCSIRLMRRKRGERKRVRRGNICSVRLVTLDSWEPHTDEPTREAFLFFKIILISFSFF